MLRRRRLAPNGVGVIVDHLPAHRARGEVVVADLAHRGHLGRGAGQETFLEIAHFLGLDRPFDYPIAARLGLGDYRAPGDAVGIVAIVGVGYLVGEGISAAVNRKRGRSLKFVAAGATLPASSTAKAL